MEISAEKTKLMTNTTSGINTEIKINGYKLEIVTSFKYLGSVITDEGSKPEILSLRYKQMEGACLGKEYASGSSARPLQWSQLSVPAVPVIALTTDITLT